MAKTSTFCSN